LRYARSYAVSMTCSTVTWSVPGSRSPAPRVHHPHTLWSGRKTQAQLCAHFLLPGCGAVSLYNDCHLLNERSFSSSRSPTEPKASRMRRSYAATNRCALRTLAENASGIDEPPLFEQPRSACIQFACEGSERLNPAPVARGVRQCPRRRAK